MNDQALEVIIRPGGLRLEWAQTRDRYPEPAVQFQQELFRQYHADPDDWLLVLSFADPNLPLPPALAFWRDFTSGFAAQLAHLPDLEALREKATVALDEDDARAWLARAPLGPGAEYLKIDLLQLMWLTLHDAFRRQITSYAQFIPDCSSSKWSKHVTNSPFLARLATAGSNAAYKIISACSNAVS